MKPSIILVAPLSLDSMPESLGAKAKIEVVIGILSDLGFEVNLVDSSHPYTKKRFFWQPGISRREARVEGSPIYWWRPFTVANKRLGKFLNILILRTLLVKLASLRPSFVWIYNAYAFEGRLALKLSSRCAVPIILELEDLPLARNRRFNPKPYLDEFYFHKLLKRVALVTYVNHVLMKRYNQIDARRVLLPSILRNELVDHEVVEKFRGTVFKLGYFGGLELDKGADTLLRTLPLLPANWQLVVTGKGKLETEFLVAARKYPAQLRFLGVLDREQLTAEMLACDAIVNPHKAISDMGDGVFPFKVCESIAAGALLVSTRLPEIDIDTSLGVLFFSGSSESLVDALSHAADFYASHRAHIEHLRVQICSRFGRAAVKTCIAQELSHIAAMPDTVDPSGAISDPVSNSS